MSNDRIALAIKQRNRLIECAKEFRFHGRKHQKDSPGRNLAELDAQACEEAAKMMQHLGTEVTRLRLGIQHFAAGRMSRGDLIAMTTNWNYATDEDLPQP